MRSSLRHRCSSRWRLGLLLVLGLAFSGIAQAIPISHKRTLNNVDYVVGGIAGVGGGSGTITISDVSGTVTQAFLYWHGISPGTYDNPTVTINGNSVTGNSLGDSATNCWGSGSSRAFEADVTPFVTGNGPYTIAGLSSCAGCNANGASLVVVFNDGNPGNNHDLGFFSGNDSNLPFGFPGEDDGWHASLPGIIYGGGPVMAVFHSADGQVFPDGSLTLSTGAASVTIPDTTALWDGNSLPSAGTSRASDGGLWDILRFDITAAFDVPGTKTLNVDGMGLIGFTDCVGLVLMLLELEPTAIEVLIDVKPGEVDNPINLRSKGVIPVAILTTDLFDAQDINPLDVRFGRGQAIEAHLRGHLEDVNGDGRLDMVLHFRVQQSGILPTDLEVCLTGKTTNGTPFQGCNSVTVLH